MRLAAALAFVAALAFAPPSFGAAVFIREKAAAVSISCTAGSYVAGTGTQGTSQTVTVSPPAGAVILVYTQYLDINAGGFTISSVTDGGDSYSVVVQFNATNGWNTGIAFAANVAGGSTSVVVHYSGNVNWRSVLVDYCTGSTVFTADGSSATGATSVGSGSTITSGTFSSTPTAGDLVWGVASSNQFATPVPSAGSGFTGLQTATGIGGLSEWLIQGSATAATETAGTSSSFTAAGMGLKP